MTIISSQSIGSKCRSVKHRLVYGKAFSKVPANTKELFKFRVMKLERIWNETNDGNDVVYSIQYKLVDTDTIVQATNTGPFHVDQGNSVVLTEYIGFMSGEASSEKTYDVYCGCSSGRFGVVVEPSLGMIYPLVHPNFTGCDNNGFPYTLEAFLQNTSCLNGRSAGALAILDKEYFPLRAKYQGGEVYIDSKTGKKSHRKAGEVRSVEKYGMDGKVLFTSPLYYMRRELVLDKENYYYKRREFANTTDGSLHTYLNSPYLYQYIDGTDCAFSMPPVFNLSRGQSSSMENWQAFSWKTTDDPDKAQLDYDLFLCPKQAENESIPPGSVVEIKQETYTKNYLPTRNNSWGMQISDYGTSLAHTVIVPYCVIEPPVSNWFAAIDGQVRTYGVQYVRTQFVPTSHNHICETLHHITEIPPLDLLVDYPVESLRRELAAFYTWDNTGTSAPAIPSESDQMLGLLMYMFCNQFWENPDAFDYVKEDYPNIALPQNPYFNGNINLALYYELFGVTMPVCQMTHVDVPIYYYTWFKYILVYQMLILESGDELPPIITQGSIGSMTQYIMQNTARILQDRIGNGIAQHPSEQEMKPKKDCPSEPGQLDPEILVKCELCNATQTSARNNIDVIHNVGVTGEPSMISRDSVVNKRNMQPCRGCFTVIGNNMSKHANLFMLMCQNDFGVLTQIHDQRDTKIKQNIHYLIERQLVDSIHQRYDLVLRSNAPYKHHGELNNYVW